MDTYGILIILYIDNIMVVSRGSDDKKTSIDSPFCIWIIS